MSKRWRAEGPDPGARVAAAVTRKRALYLGRYATVMGAEEAGIMLAWEGGAKAVALGSQGAIARTAQLDYTRAMSWIRRMAARAPTGNKGHSGIVGTQAADKMARKEALRSLTYIATDLGTLKH